MKKQINNFYFSRTIRQSRYATNTISAWNFLMVQSGKKCSSLIFWKHGAVNEFYGSIDVSSQMRGAEFPVIYGLEKPKLLLTGTYTSTSTRHVTLNLLSYYSFRIVNCAIMIINNQIIDQWIFCSVQKPYLLILANLQSSKRKKKETLPFSYRFSPTCISLNVKFSIPKSWKFFTFFSFLGQSSCTKS